MALGYKKKDDMGGGDGEAGGYSEGTGEADMSLKSFVKAMKEDKPEEESEAATATAEEEPAAEAEEEPEQDETERYMHEAKVLGGMHNHMSKAHEWLSGQIPKMSRPKVSKGMKAHLKDLEGHQENYKSLAAAHYPDLNFDKMCKSLEGGETETEDNETGANSDAEATSTEDHGSTDESGQELIEQYQHPKGGKGQVKKSDDEELTKTLAGTLATIKGVVDQRSDAWFKVSGQRV